MSQLTSQPDGNTLVLPKAAIDDTEVVSLNVENLDVQELEHRLELAASVANVPCIVDVHWDY